MQPQIHALLYLLKNANAVIRFSKRAAFSCEIIKQLPNTTFHKTSFQNSREKESVFTAISPADIPVSKAVNHDCSLHHYYYQVRSQAKGK